MSKQIVSQTKKGLFWDLLGAFFRQFASVFISIILARLLSPEEFGIVGMALVFVSITEVFIDVGFTSGLIQQKDTKDIAYSSIFYVNLGISILLSAVIVIVAPYVADFYEQPQVADILYYLALIPIIGALGRVQSTILTKRMDFRSLTIRNITATVGGGIAGVIAAYAGMGLYALVVQQIFTAIAGTVLLWSSAGWRPKWEYSKEEVKKLLGYSAYIFFDQALRQVFNKIDTIFIGKAFSPVTLGYYSRAESLKSQVDSYASNSLRKVMFPVLSTLQEDPAGFKKMFYKVSNIVTGLTVMLVGSIYFMSNEIIIGLLGEKWAPSIIFFQILLFTTITTPQTGIMVQAVLAKGYSKLKFKMGLIQRGLKLLPIIFGLLYGIVEFAIAVVIAANAVFFVYAYVIHTKFDISFRDQIINLLKPSIVFFIFIIGYQLYEVNPWIYTIAFLLCNTLFLRIIKHESFNILINTKNLVIGKLKKFKK